MPRIKFCIPGMENFQIYQSLIQETGLEAGFREGDTRPDSDELRIIANKNDIVVGAIKERYDASVLDETSRVKLICTHTSGTDHIDLGLCEKLGIKVVNTAGANAIPCAEYSIGAAISLAKSLCLPNAEPTEISRLSYARQKPADFYARNTLIIGAGQIAQALSKLLSGFDARQVVWTYSPEKYGSVFGKDIVFEHDLKSAIVRAEYIFLCLPMSSKSGGLLGADMLSQNETPSYFISVSRPGLIADGFFAKGVNERIFSGVCLDIASQSQKAELEPLNNCIFSQHIAGDTADTAINMQNQIATGIRAFLKGAPFGTP